MACTAETLSPGSVPVGEFGREQAGMMNVLSGTVPELKVEKATACNESGSPDMRDEAGASSGESNTEKAGDGLKIRQPGAKGANIAPVAAPSNQTEPGEDGGGLNAQQGKEGKGDKSMKLPRPEGTARCPRCDSDDTKFCYYNNYNVKQPRYFCKACQRYWTAGGTLRNVPVGAGRRKNKNAAAGEKQKGKVSSEGMENGSFVPFGPLLGLDQGLGYAGPVSAPGKGALAPFMPSLPQLSALAYPPVDPSVAAAAVAALPSQLAAGIDPAQFCAPSTSQRSGQALGEDGSRNGRRVRSRKNNGDAAHPADSSQQGSASTMATELPGAVSGMLGGIARNRAAEPCMGGALGEAAGGGVLSSFQPFQGPAFAAAAAGNYVQPSMSSPMSADWYSMAAAAGQQQAAAAQQQLQYQAAAAMQAQALQAAAAGWSQGSNPYMSGLCFPYNFYGANPQLAAAYASLGGQQWNAMDVAAAQGGGQVQGGAVSSLSGPVGSSLSGPSQHPAQQAWGGKQPQTWGSGGSSNHQTGGSGSLSGAWQVWPGQGSEMSGGDGQPAASQQSKAQHHNHHSNAGNKHHHQQQHHQHQFEQHRFTPSGMPALHGANSSLLSGNSGSSALTAGPGEMVPNGGMHHHHTHSIDTAG